MPPLFLKTGRPDVRQIWDWFFILFALNALLAWGPWTAQERLLLFPLGLVLQSVLVLRLPFFAKLKPETGSPAAGIDPWVAAWALGALALFLRFYGLVSVPAWPTWDDANYSYFAIGLSEKGSWPLLIGHEKTMPLFTWLQGAFFRAFQPSLFSMWFYPALLSLAAFPLGWWAARRFFPPRFSFYCASLLALGFWTIYYGKFVAYLGVLQWVVELTLLGVLGLFLKAPSRRAAGVAVLLGLCVGGSFYSSMLFVAPAVLVTAGVFIHCLKKPELGWKIFGAYLTPALALSLPMDLAFFRNLTSGHVFTYSVFSPQQNGWERQIATTLSYFTSLFWGPIDRSYWSFAPLWGGFFNPLWDALFFTGLGAWRGFLGKTGVRWWAAALGLLLLPAFFFNTLECFRTDLVMPLCLLPVAGGLGILLSTLSPFPRKAFLLLALVLSIGLDGYHLFGVFHQWSVQMIPGIQIKSPERYKAFQVLEETERNQGPGLIFSDFVSDAYDQSLLVSTYPFNAARNPRLSPERVRWAGILADLHYLQPLQKRFPRTRFQVLSDPQSGGPILCLALVPIISPAEQKTFLEWKKVHQALQDTYGDMPYVVKSPDFTPVLEKLQVLYPACSRDGLLKAWVLEKMLDILLVSPDLTPAQWFLDRPVAATRSFPFLDRKFAGVYHRLGLALLKNGDKARARESFQRAAVFDPRYELKKWLALAGGR